VLKKGGKAIEIATVLAKEQNDKPLAKEQNEKPPLPK